MAYIELDDFLEYIGSQVPDDEPSVERALNAAQAAINDHCGRTFNPPTNPASPTTKSYVPDDRHVVTIHDLVDDTSLVVVDNGETIDASDYLLEPFNQWTGARPYYRIRRLNGCWQWDCYGRPTISITSPRWGWAAVPAEVVEATAILAKDLVHLRENRFGVAGFGEFGVIRVRDNPHVTMLLKPYLHPSKIGIA